MGDEILVSPSTSSVPADPLTPPPGPATHADVAATSRSKRVVGFSKSGLSVALTERPGQLVFRGRADPLLLYLAIGGALGLGLLASILRSPAQGFISSFLFSALFSPLLLFLIYSTLRLRTHCVISKADGSVYIRERSFRREYSLTLPIADLTGVVVQSRSQMPVVGGPESYSLYLETPDARYPVLVGYDESAVQRLAERVGEQLKLPLIPLVWDVAEEGQGVRGKVLATTALLYLAPTLLGIAIIYLASPEVSTADRLMLTSLGAIVLSQLGAILAFAYYRSRESNYS